MSKRSQPYRKDKPIIPELSSGGVVITPDLTRILLLHEVTEDRWCLPKGHVDDGETLVRTAMREIQEETGLDGLALKADLGEVTYRFYDPRRSVNVLKVAAYFLFRTLGEEVTLEDIFDRHAWLSPSEALSRASTSERIVIERAVRWLDELPSRNARSP